MNKIKPFDGQKDQILFNQLGLRKRPIYFENVGGKTSCLKKVHLMVKHPVLPALSDIHAVAVTCIIGGSTRRTF